MNDSYTFVEHIDELRHRILYCLGFILAAGAGIFLNREFYLSEVTRYLDKLIFITPQEAFIANLKLAFFGGIFLAAPFIIYQIWKFVEPGLKKKERKFCLVFVPFLLIFFWLGAGFAYLLVLPIAIEFLLGFGGITLMPMITVSEYLSFVFLLTIVFGIIFELPVVIYFLDVSGIVPVGYFRTNRKYFVLIIFIAAAVLTPPDIVTQIFLAGPLLILYQLSIWGVGLINRGNS